MCKWENQDDQPGDHKNPYKGNRTFYLILLPALEYRQVSEGIQDPVTKTSCKPKLEEKIGENILPWGMA